MKIQIHYPETIESGDTINTLPVYSINGVEIKDIVTFELVRRALQRFENAAGVKIGDPNGNLATSSITQEIVHEMIEVIESVNGNEQLLDDYLTEHVLPEDLSIQEEPEQLTCVVMIECDDDEPEDQVFYDIESSNALYYNGEPMSYSMGGIHAGAVSYSSYPEPELIDASKYLDDDFEDISSIGMLGASYDLPNFDELKRVIDGFKAVTNFKEDVDSTEIRHESEDSWETNHVFRTENVNTRPTRLVDLKKFGIRR